MKPQNDDNSTDEIPQYTFTDTDKNILIARFDEKFVNDAEKFLNDVTFNKDDFLSLFELLKAEKMDQDAINKKITSIQQALAKDAALGECIGNKIAVRRIYRFLAAVLGAVAGFFAGAKAGVLTGGVVLSVPNAITGAVFGSITGASLGFFAGTKIFNLIHPEQASDIHMYDRSSSLLKQVTTCKK